MLKHLKTSILTAIFLVLAIPTAWALNAAELENAQTRALKGDIAALVEVADHYYAKGQCAEALKWYQMAAENGQFDSRARIAHIYAFGTCADVPRDIVKGYVLFRKILATYNLYPESQTAFENYVQELKAKMSAEKLKEAENKITDNWHF